MFQVKVRKLSFKNKCFLAWRKKPVSAAKSLNQTLILGLFPTGCEFDLEGKNKRKHFLCLPTCRCLLARSIRPFQVAERPDFFRSTLRSLSFSGFLVDQSIKRKAPSLAISLEQLFRQTQNDLLQNVVHVTVVTLQ